MLTTMSAYRLRADSKQGSDRYETFAARLHRTATWDMPTAKKLAVGAVIREPVSSTAIPCSTGKYREIGQF